MTAIKIKGNLHLLEQITLYKDDDIEICLSPTNMRTTVRYVDTSYRWKKNVIMRKVVEYRISSAQEIYERHVEIKRESLNILSYLVLRSVNGVAKNLKKLITNS